MEYSAPAYTPPVAGITRIPRAVMSAELPGTGRAESVMWLR